MVRVRRSQRIGTSIPVIRNAGNRIDTVRAGDADQRKLSLFRNLRRYCCLVDLSVAGVVDGGIVGDVVELIFQAVVEPPVGGQTAFITDQQTVERLVDFRAAQRFVP